MNNTFHLSEINISEFTRTFTIACILASVIALFSGPVYAQSYDATAQAGDEIEFEYELDFGLNTQLRFTAKTEDQTATAGEDYDSIDQKVVLAAGTRKIVVKTDTHANDNSTGTEQFKLTLSNPQIPGQTQGTWASVQIYGIPSTITLIGEISH